MSNYPLWNPRATRMNLDDAYGDNGIPPIVEGAYFWPPSGGAPATANLDPATTTGTAASFTVTGAASVGLLPAATTGTAAVLAANAGAPGGIAPLPAASSASSVGGMAATGAASTFLVAVSRTSSAGPMAATGAARANLPAASGAGSAGSLAASSSAAAALVYAVVTSTAGPMTGTGGAVALLAPAQATSSADPLNQATTPIFIPTVSSGDGWKTPMRPAKARLAAVAGAGEAGRMSASGAAVAVLRPIQTRGSLGRVRAKARPGPSVEEALLALLSAVNL